MRSQVELRLSGLAASAFLYPLMGTKRQDKVDDTPKSWERDKSELGNRGMWMCVNKPMNNEGDSIYFL